MITEELLCLGSETKVHDYFVDLVVRVVDVRRGVVLRHVEKKSKRQGGRLLVVGDGSCVYVNSEDGNRVGRQKWKDGDVQKKYKKNHE